MVYDIQKASTWKRASAFLFDAILISVLVVGCAYLLSAVLGYDSYSESFEKGTEKYEQLYTVDFEITQEQYEALDEASKKNYDDAFAALNADNEVVYAYSMLVNLALVILSVSVLVSVMVFGFVIPLIFGNGQTLGKKIFGVAVMRTDGVKVNSVVMLIRVLLGQYTIEIMVPLLLVLMIYFNFIGLVGTVVIGLILVLQLIIFCATGTNSLIHDLLAKTVAVDMASQLIFDTEEDMIEFKKKAAAEKAARREYE